MNAHSPLGSILPSEGKKEGFPPTEHLFSVIPASGGGDPYGKAQDGWPIQTIGPNQP